MDNTLERMSRTLSYATPNPPVLLPRWSLLRAASRSLAGYGRGERSTASATDSITMFTPRPRARAPTMTAEAPGSRHIRRNASRRSLGSASTEILGAWKRTTMERAAANRTKEAGRLPPSTDHSSLRSPTTSSATLGGSNHSSSRSLQSGRSFTRREGVRALSPSPRSPRVPGPPPRRPRVSPGNTASCVRHAFGPTLRRMR